MTSAKRKLALTLTFWAVMFMTVLIATIRLQLGSSAVRSERLAVAMTCAAVLYFASHAMRAVRLAVIAMPLTGMSFRTACLLHLVVSPWSLVAPFKLDELVRLRELRRGGGSWPRAIVTVLIDRSMDGVILLGLAITLLLDGQTKIAGFVGFVGSGLTIIAVSFFVLPTLLEAVQRHVFIHHYHVKAPQLLDTLSRLRRLLSISRQAISTSIAFLAVATLGIWGLEAAAVAALSPVLQSLASPLEAIGLMLHRADDGWRVMLFASPSRGAVALLTVNFVIGLLLPWPAIAFFYYRRQLEEPRRSPMRVSERNVAVRRPS